MLSHVRLLQFHGLYFIYFRISHSLLWSTTFKGFGIVNKAEIDVFLELSCFFDDPADVGNLISGSSAFSKTSLNIWKFMVHVLLKPGLENFKQYFTIMWDECNCAVVWAFSGVAFFCDYVRAEDKPKLYSEVPSLRIVWRRQSPQGRSGQRAWACPLSLPVALQESIF